MAGGVSYNFSENVQRGILKLFKEDFEFHNEIASLVQPEYFEFPVHEILFRVVAEHREKYGSLPKNEFIVETVKKVVPEGEDLSDYTDELEFIDGLNEEREASDFYLDLVEDFARKAAIKQALQECVTLVRKDDIDGCEALIRDAMLVSRTVDIGQDYFSDVEDRWKRVTAKKEDGQKFGTLFETHNEYLEGGNDSKELAIVAAPPGVGKSLYLVNQSVKALTEGKKVLYVSLEMSEDKIARRVDSVATVLPNSKLNESTTQVDLRKRLEIFQSKFPGARLFIKEYPSGTINVNGLRALLTQLRIRHGFHPDLVVVDYLELLNPTRRIDAEYQAQQRIARELRGLASEYQCLVWTGTQTNREGSKAAIIDQVHMGDSFGKIREADWAISLNQTAQEYDEGKMRVFVMKARDSKQKYTIRANVDYNTLRISQEKKEEDLDEQIDKMLDA